MGRPDEFMHTHTKNDIIEPTAVAIEPYMSPAGTYLWVIDDNDIEALRAGRLLVFCMEDYENVLIQWREVPE